MELGVEEKESNYKNFAQSFHKSFPLSLFFAYKHSSRKSESKWMETHYFFLTEKVYCDFI